MPLSSISFPQGLPSFVGAAGYPTSGSARGATIFVSSVLSRGDGRTRLKFFGSAAVSPSQGNQQGPQGDPTDPLKTVFGAAGALAFCAANRGDVIVVDIGHLENLSNNSTYTIPAGVTIVGAGYGSQRPTFTFTGGTATNITFGGSALLQGLIFDLTGVASVAQGFNVTTGGVQMANLRIIAAGATNHATTAVSLNAADFVMFNCEIDATGASTGTANGINISGANCTRAEIIYNYMHGNFSTSCLSCTNANPLLECVVQLNDFRQTNATAAQAVISIVGAAATGVIAFNNLYVNATTTGVGSSMVGTPTSTGLVWNQNFGYNNVANKGGTLIPAAGAALT